jgi:hypothetical protein
MTSKKFRDHLHSRPFRPYTICMADGQELKVIHPDFVAVDPAGREAVVYDQKGKHHYVDLLLVTSIRIEAGPESVTSPEG